MLGRRLVIERGEGSHVHTTDGRRLLDGTAGLWHANVGHSRPELAPAAYDQTLQLESYHTFARYSNDKAMAPAERLAAISPIADPKVVLNSGGSDAIDVACKLARRHWQREGREGMKTIISREFTCRARHRPPRRPRVRLTSAARHHVADQPAVRHDPTTGWCRSWPRSSRPSATRRTGERPRPDRTRPRRPGGGRDRGRRRPWARAPVRGHPGRGPRHR
ncbi:aminotransferase class III-fold pyridoxal phosphate-dependent enzyme [Pseudonocardia sp. N23]|uniref:aminotransferase class III-fold pyridoxal phosphate-dependent enzyme n=1 Tax=Pseudonocardia sp. N23 TaxID=1987376 RepID=UPI000BFB4BE4